MKRLWSLCLCRAPQRLFCYQNLALTLFDGMARIFNIFNSFNGTIEQNLTQPFLMVLIGLSGRSQGPLLGS